MARDTPVVQDHDGVPQTHARRQNAGRADLKSADLGSGVRQDQYGPTYCCGYMLIGKRKGEKIKRA